MNCEKYREMISTLVDGELATEEKIDLQNHLDKCSACRQVMEEMQHLHHMIISEEPVSMPAEVERKILAHAAGQNRRKNKLTGLFGGYYRIPRSAVWATLVVLVVLAVNSFINPLTQSGQTEITYDSLESEIKVQKIELTEADVVGVRTFTGNNNGS